MLLLMKTFQQVIPLPWIGTGQHWAFGSRTFLTCRISVPGSVTLIHSSIVHNVTWSWRVINSPFQDIDSENAEEDEFYDQEPLPVLGRCKAIYTFEGNFSNVFFLISPLSSFLRGQHSVGGAGGTLVDRNRSRGRMDKVIFQSLDTFFNIFNPGSGVFTLHTLIRCLRALFLRLT